MSQTNVGHCKKDSTDVYIGRGPNARDMTETPIGERGWLGNPYPVSECDSRLASIEAFKADFLTRLKVDPKFREAVTDLSGKTLGCWCQELDDETPPCHGEIIARWADRLDKHGHEVIV